MSISSVRIRTWCETGFTQRIDIDTAGAYGESMNEANKRFPYLSPAVAQDRLEAVEWLMDNLDYTWDECTELSLKQMRILRAEHDDF